MKLYIIIITLGGLNPWRFDPLEVMVRGILMPFWGKNSILYAIPVVI